MTNGQKNKAFFSMTDAKTARDVLSAIATHYGITSDEARADVTSDDSEHLLDYLTGATRTAVSLLMKRNGLA
jgi:hypothetical protein